MKQYKYEPGNATRYHLVYGKVEGSGVSGRIQPGGALANRYLIAWLKDGGSGGTAMQWNHWDDMPTPGWIYISEKMDINQADAKAIAMFIEAHHPTRVAENGGE